MAAKTQGGRLTVWLGMTVALALGLAGCSLLPAAVGLGPGSGVPQRGECWNISNADAANWAYWEQSAHVDCAGTHDLYTYAVPDLSGFSATSWAGSDPTQPTQAIIAAINTVCPDTQLIPHLKWNETLVQGFYFLPSESQWASGARWVRCDIGVLAYKTTIGNRQLAKLPSRISTLVSEATSDPLRFDYCVDSDIDAEVAGPLANPDFDFVTDCRHPHEWMLVGRGTLPAAVGSPFPTGATQTADSSKVCSGFANKANETWYAYLPQETATATVGSDRQVTCWVGRVFGDDDGNGGVA